MTFLQPLLLIALPLVALPVVIHLLNQRRYQTVRWGAMMFLLAASRTSSGYAKLRQWLILLFRMLAVAGVILAVSRPLAGGWLGTVVGGRPDTTIILLDRSPSMRQQGPGTVVSKLDAGRQQLAQSLPTLGSGRWVLIDSTTNLAREIESPAALLAGDGVDPAGASANVPAMLEAARDYVRNNRCGRTEVWICSDTRANDWAPDGAGWQALRDSFLEFSQGIRFHLLAYADPAPGNVAVTVTNVRRLRTADGADLLISFKLTREGNADAPLTVPVRFEIEGARSEVTVELHGLTYELKDHRIPIERTRERGWGKVSIPADVNPADDEFYFAFDKQPPRRTLIVSEDPTADAALELAAAVPPDPGLACGAEFARPEHLGAVEWDALALILWHAPLPGGDAAKSLQAFVGRGGQVMFLPARAPGDAEFMGIRWRDWTGDATPIPVETWRGDQDILANTQSGAALPVGRLQVRRVCGVEGELTPLAALKGGKLLVGRLPTNRGGVYFFATTAAPADSSLAADGVALYAVVQRGIAAGAAVLGQARQLVAGDVALEQPAAWKQIAGPPDAVSTEYAYQAGVYQTGERLLAVNRAAAEDHAPVLPEARVAALFKGLDFSRVDDRAGSLAGLIQEVWRVFLVLMLIALVTEAALCLPRRVTKKHAPGFGFGPPDQRARHQTPPPAAESPAAPTPQGAAT